ncbi:MAG: class I SAM-dependent methyltransferase [Nanoarchaeota archaeon]|nr:class I SAM-dependent methyltransferase [Nanoarchaeota archaeon]
MSILRNKNNGWVKYWQDRVSTGGNYYGKKTYSADRIIKILNIQKNDTVLDIGCAKGAHLTDIKDKTKAKCYGIDISSIAISLNTDKRIALKVADMEKTGYKENKFTKVFSLGTFEHTPRSLSVFKELNRIMKKDGVALITVPNKYAFNHITKNIKMVIGTWDLGYERSFTRGELRRIFARSGFKLEKYWVDPHIQVANVFNYMDNRLNKINNKHFGFFVYTVLRKVENVH